MIPNTLNFMIAGYAVILIGIAGYIFSLIARSAKIKRKINTSSAKIGSEEID